MSVQVADAGLFAEPEPQPTPVTRPDGRVYRPKLLPEAVVFGEDGDIEGCMVMRTHSIDVANRLAVAALCDQFGYGAAENDQDVLDQLTQPALVWGHWRPDRTYDRVWEADPTGLRGTPAVQYEMPR